MLLTSVFKLPNASGESKDFASMLSNSQLSLLKRTVTNYIFHMLIPMAESSQESAFGIVPELACIFKDDRKWGGPEQTSLNESLEDLETL
ncbi:hypothetical protein Y032_0124g1246 [Ancylostoma ceylanicum]|uniref:Uncharacterized protein n=1 Tax=Ancylostoma ceylanicum TaxID=53326 RepID=A0A016T9B7_9BILA|nr:hypothetical protein Y032_0124g1246 [Ancylostoma ceylanicum]